MPNEILIPKFSAMKPNIGGARRKTRKDIWANDATLIAAGLSVFWAAADIASGNITAEPPPINTKPTNDKYGELEKHTDTTPISIATTDIFETFSDPYISTYWSA